MIQLWSLDCWHFLGLVSKICVEESASTAPSAGHTRIYTNPGQRLLSALNLCVSGSDDINTLDKKVCDVTTSCSWGQQGVWWHHILLKGTKSEDFTSFWRQRGPAAARRTLVGPQGCTASSAASLCTHRQDNAEDRPSCTLATREENELQVFHLKWGNEQ